MSIDSIYAHEIYHLYWIRVMHMESTICSGYVWCTWNLPSVLDTCDAYGIYQFVESIYFSRLSMESTRYTMHIKYTRFVIFVESIRLYRSMESMESVGYTRLSVQSYWIREVSESYGVHEVLGAYHLLGYPETLACKSFCFRFADYLLAMPSNVRQI